MSQEIETIKVQGGLTIRNNAAVRRQILNKLASGAGCICLDFGGTGDADAVGAGCMDFCYRRCLDYGVRLELQNVPDSLERQLQHIGLSARLKLD